MFDDNSKLKIIQIGGFGRSGSTLLEMLLGQIEGVFAVGEIKAIWEQGFLMNDPCSCGIAITNCEFWNNVMEEAFGGIHQVDIQEIIRLQLKISRIYNIPKFILGKTSENFTDQLNKYSSLMENLYQAISRVSGCSVIVDSTKDAPHGFILAKLKNIDHFVVHLVRDSRGVGFSWQKKRLRNLEDNKTDFMQQFTPFYSSYSWVLYNSLFHLFGMLYRGKYYFLRYEDFSAAPQKYIREIMRFHSISDEQLDLIQDFYFQVGEHHTVSGNPIRFKKGKMKIKTDLEWQRSMQPSHKLIITMLTWPLLLKYHYLF